MTFSYRLLIRLATPLVFIYLWLRGAKAAEYRQRWRERLALHVLPVQARDGIVIHCVSVGETIAARALIEAVLAAYPKLPVTLTSMTPTAAAIAQRFFGERVFHSYLPIDTPGAMKRFFRKLAPRMVVVLETEVWPCFVAEANRRGIPLLVVNARMSERSQHGYQRYAWLLGPVWQQLSFVAAQTAESEQRFRQLGVAPQQLAVRGNLKHDIQLAATLPQQANDWRQALQRPVLVAASTHDGEDEQVLSAFQTVLKVHPQALLILVPRHPERFTAVAQLIENAQLSYIRRSDNKPVTTTHQVFLADTMGELMLWYAIADGAFIGGSLIERGGHNPLEPIATETPIATGPHVFNFEQLFTRLKHVDGVALVNSAEALATTWSQWLTEPDTARAMALRAQHEFADDRGATKAILADIQRFLPSVEMTEQHRTMAMMTTVQPHKKSMIWYDPELLKECPVEYFSPSYWQAQGKVKGSATGRSTAFFIDQGDHDLLLRHYYRGGLVGKFNRDRFKREPIAESRAMAEFSLLLKLRELGLPVPRPVAAYYAQAPGWGYRADILVEVIPHTQDLFKLLQQRELTPAKWDTIGQAIRELHNANVYHSDLNCRNIMLDSAGKCWIVDFDKCDIRESGSWKEANLQRLLRSFNKELTKATNSESEFHFNEARDWPLLIAAYQR